MSGFLSESEASALLAEVERAPFRAAQSGKLKQHYGAKVNFNKRRVNARAFTGLPGYVGRIERRLHQRIESATFGPVGRSNSALAEALERYRTMDAFVLRYHEHDQSNLDLHLDDTFAYGEVILDLSLESDSVMTFARQRREEGDACVWDCVCVSRCPCAHWPFSTGRPASSGSMACLPTTFVAGARASRCGR
jgi:hypothetical protein